MSTKSNESLTLSQVMARFVSDATFAQLAAADVTAAQIAMSDCLGCMIAGAPDAGPVILRRVTAAAARPGKSTVIGSSARLVPQAAALVNGMAAHALDYDDILWTLYGHPSASILSAALAVAEAVDASGRDLVLAYAIGVELLGKLGRHVNPLHYEHGWHATATIGVIGAAAAAAKLMSLSAEQTAMALGIAASQASGVRRNFGTMTKPFHPGNAARAGIVAAELAKEGFTSDLTAFEGDYGWAKTMNGRTVPPAAALSATLGLPWEVSAPGIVLKRYPACGGTHCALDAMVAVVKDHQLKADEIERIVCDASPFAKKVLLYPRPKTGLEGKFSMEFSLAVVAIAGQAALPQYSDAWTARADVQRLYDRIEFNSRADLEPDVSADAVPAEVFVHARGQVFSKKVLVPSGDPRNPMTTAERREKFAGCTAGQLDAGRTAALFDHCERFTDFDDLGALLAPLAGVW